METYQTDTDRARSNDARGLENHGFDDDFTTIELRNSLKHLKNEKATGLDEILTEDIKDFGPVTIQWVLNLLNACAEHTAYRDSGDRHVLLLF